MGTLNSTVYSKNNRTLLVYMGGNNNLSKETYDKIEALKKSYVSSMGRLLILQAAKGGSPKLMEIGLDSNGHSELKILKTYPSGNAASKAVFKEALQDVVKEAYADSYGLVLFSHASGWLPERTLIRPRTILQDGDQDMELTDFAAAIPDHFFDFMIFESCFMAGIEVAYELKDKTDYIVASSAEILSPGFIDVYPKMLPCLYKPAADLTSFAQLYFNHYNQKEGELRAATIAVIDTKTLPALAEWVRQNVDYNFPPGDLKDLQHFDRYQTHRLFFDFEDYYRRLSPPASHKELTTLLQNTVKYKAATPRFLMAYNGFAIDQFSGLTSYIPQKDFEYLNVAYKKLKWTLAVNP
ncbi:hypothetical protein H9X96_11060 [Pedobacter sp. N36a]|uniref:clostripain-related cysteine peptidase n=1 Tax=Pedobacter sp. N36a TaxID=2767996 RepID=UPI0016572265|nr:clostripain-related cysteine peptidase [Pedobacter sp. N36a]MBC8986315.1 hypothetical protein [Pedobacter sp. N36a]